MTFEERVGVSGKVHTGYILLWNFSDPINPQVVLEAPGEEPVVARLRGLPWSFNSAEVRRLTLTRMVLLCPLTVVVRRAGGIRQGRWRSRSEGRHTPRPRPAC